MDNEHRLSVPTLLGEIKKAAEAAYKLAPDLEPKFAKKAELWDIVSYIESEAGFCMCVDVNGYAHD